MTARMWPHLGIKTGGIKRGELVVIGAFSKKDKCMYQIQVRYFSKTEWSDYGRPWLTYAAAEKEIESRVQLDNEDGDWKLWVYRIVEV